ncbi:MAG: tRNA adenosine(34) deaminase TadA [Planctomycetota bacterium]|nr:tRNA adenosine(34) deaminase TadA [Planctomycetota bacterium]
MNETMMQRALELAEQASQLDEVPIGAVVIHEGQIIGEGYNTKEHGLNPTAHAEMIAIQQAAEHLGRWRLHGCTIYVTLEPCPMCAGAIVNARMDKVVFGARDPKSGACESLFTITNDERLNHRCEVEGGILEEDCVAILQSFFKAKR